MADAQKSRGRAMEEAVSRAVRDNLIPLQRTLEELQQAYADLVSACSSTRPTNALPAMLRAQATSASLTASLSVLSTFITSVMQQRDRETAEEGNAEPVRAVGVEAPAFDPPVAPAKPAHPEIPVSRAQETSIAEEPAEETLEVSVDAPVAAHAEPIDETVYVHESIAEEPQATSAAEIASEPVVEESEPFDVANLPADEQELHKRANRVAKVSMQDIKMLKPEEVRKGREKKDICVRLRVELDKARKEYDRRFQKILDHPVDYFHHWLVEILGNGDPETLGEYPYPSPVLRR
jgi:hypothetical protein